MNLNSAHCADKIYIFASLIFPTRQDVKRVDVEVDVDCNVNVAASEEKKMNWIVAFDWNFENRFIAACNREV